MPKQKTLHLLSGDPGKFDKIIQMLNAVGIDLGTSNSAVAAFVQGKHQILPDVHGQRLTPSIVSFGKDSKILIGNDAKAQLFSNPKRTIASVKRLMGRKYFSPEVKKAQAILPFNLVEGVDQNVAVEIDGHQYSPQEISALILKHMKEIAAHALSSEVTDAVITVPAYFNDNQRQATQDACKIAGLKVLRMINEPTAAALAYGFGKGLNETVAIYDLGGGTFDVSILRLKDKVFEVIATAGDTFLGGDDFDDRIIDLCCENFLKRYNVDLRQMPEALPVLRVNAEKAKRKLSYAEKTDIYIPAIAQKDDQTIDFQFALSREQFRESTKDLVQRTFTVCDEALRSAQLRSSDLDAIILVGGPTKMSLVYEAVAAYFGKTPLRDHNPDEVVALGASIQAQALTSVSAVKSKTLLLDVTPLNLGIATVGGYIETIVEANTPIPVEQSRKFTTVKDQQKTVDVRIYQGQNRRVEESSLLGEFEFSGFKTGKSGDVTIEVLFAINTDGIVEVSAKDPDTGAAQTVQVKLSAAMSKNELSASTQRSKELKEVKLKNEWKDASKVIVCFPGKIGSTYEEGYVRQLDPMADSFVLHGDGPKAGEKKIECSKIAWLLVVDDFANAPRYLSALENKPTEFGASPKAPLYHFKLSNQSSLYGQANLPEVREKGFWIEPYFPHDSLQGRCFVYSAHVKESAPLGK